MNMGEGEKEKSNLTTLISTVLQVQSYVYNPLTISKCYIICIKWENGNLDRLKDLRG